jgi:hypothetical protein
VHLVEPLLVFQDVLQRDRIVQPPGQPVGAGEIVAGSERLRMIRAKLADILGQRALKLLRRRSQIAGRHRAVCRSNLCVHGAIVPGQRWPFNPGEPPVASLVTGRLRQDRPRQKLNQRTRSPGSTLSHARRGMSGCPVYGHSRVDADPAAKLLAR